MGFAFNPFSGNFDQTGSGGGGASYIDGEVQNFSALPQTVGSPAVDSAYLVREAEGTWLINRKPAGIYIRTANTGVRAADWTHAGAFPDVFNDANFVLYDNADSTKNLAFQLSGITTGTTRTLTVPDKNITIADNADIPSPSTATPSALGVAAAGTGTAYAREDHVHAMPSAADVGAAAAIHAADHAAGGSDPLAPSDIGAQSLFTTTTYNITGSGSFTLSAARAQIAIIENYSGAKTVTLPTTGNQSGDVAVVRANPSIGTLTVSGAAGGSQTIPTVGSRRYVYDGTNWQRDPVYTHDHDATDVVSGTFDIARIPTGTGSTQVSLGNHTHTQLHDRSHAITSTSDHTAGNHKVFYSDGSGNVQELSLGATGTVLTSGGTAAAPSFEAASGGVTAIGASAADILSVSGSDIVADDLGSDKLYGWDDSESKAIGFTVGSGLSISGTTLTATATGTIGGSTGSTDNLILRSDGTGSATLQNSALQLDDATTSTQNNVAIVNAHSETDSALVLTPKGTGAFIVGPKPDGTSTGGNARGTNVICMVRDRSVAGQVASGNSSVAIGRRCTASGPSNVAIGNTCTAAGSNAGTAIAIGNSSTADGIRNIAIGAGNNVTAAGAKNVDGYSVGIGSANTVTSNIYGVAVGGDNEVSANYAVALGGECLVDRRGMLAFGTGQFAARGDNQAVTFILRQKTTTNAAVELTPSGGAAGAGNRLTIPSGKVLAMLINITGVKSDGTAVAHYVRQYALKNVGGTTSEIYAAVTIGTDNAASTSIALSANDTNDALKLEVTGIASETWRWVASVDAVEVAYGN